MLLFTLISILIALDFYGLAQKPRVASKPATVAVTRISEQFIASHRLQRK